MKLVFHKHCLLLLFLFLELFCVRERRGFVDMTDKEFIKTPPSILQIHENYFIVFQYGNAFWYKPESRVQDSKLIFFVSTTTSTGNTKGRWFLQEIKDSEEVLLIKQGKVFWENPSGNLQPLQLNVAKILNSAKN